MVGIVLYMLSSLMWLHESFSAQRTKTCVVRIMVKVGL